MEEEPRAYITVAPVNSSFIISDNIVSSLGFTTAENFAAVVAGKSGIEATTLFQSPLTSFGDDNHLTSIEEPNRDYVSLTNHQKVNEMLLGDVDINRYTSFEKMVILSIKQALRGCNIDTRSSNTLFVISTAKGNIDLIDPKVGSQFEPERILLWKSAEVIASHFGNPNTPVCISNACISGSLSIIYAMRALNAGLYENVVVCGCDIASPFIVAGFNCLKATDNKPCRPFDANRKGLNLGEGAATLILSAQPPSIPIKTTSQELKEQSTPLNNHGGESEDYANIPISIADGASFNDANHISGPSRTGEGLFLSIKEILASSGVSKIDFVNAHGTGTLYNDEMESIAFSRCLPPDIAVNSFKGYFGHTLGASGVIETVLCSKSLQTNTLIKTLGYEQQGTSIPLNITRETINTPLRCCLKSSSGFGGTNASILLLKG